MIAVTEEEQAWQPAVLTYSFRPMFLAAGSWAIVAIVVWLAMFLGYIQIPTRFDPLGWHIHEMLFGFVMAAVAGFLLTAISNWTGRLPVRGSPLAMLAGLWLLGRIACLISADLPAWLAISMDLSFPVTLLAVTAHEIIVGRNWRNLVMTLPLLVFVFADLLMHLESIGLAVPSGLGWRLGLVAALLLILMIGGRIIPSFTRNWLSRRKGAHLPTARDIVDKVAVTLLCVGLILWAALPEFLWGGVTLVAAAIANAWRLGRWAGLATWAEPLLFILHIGYAWLVLGTALLGLSMLDAGVPVSSAIHALTTGAVATMIVAVMPRVTLGHTGRELTANRATIIIFLLINAAAITRICASWYPELTITLLAMSGVCWISAFGLFEIVYGPMLLTRQPNRSSPSS